VQSKISFKIPPPRETSTKPRVTYQRAELKCGILKKNYARIDRVLSTGVDYLTQIMRSLRLWRYTAATWYTSNMTEISTVTE